MHDSTLQVITSSERRGAEVFAAELGRVLEQLGRPVRTVALRDGAPPGLNPPVSSLGPGATRRLRKLLELRRLATESGAVIAHGSDASIACAAATAGTQVGFVYRAIGDPDYWSAGSWRRRRMTFLLRRAAVVVVLSPRFADVLTRHYGVEPDRCSVLPNGVDPEAFPLVDAAARAHARRALGIPDTAEVIAYVGALSREKDPLAAIAAGVAAGSDLHVLMAGTGALQEAVLDAGERVMPRRLHVVGSTERPQQIYAAADVVVLPSRTEGIPAVAIEAGLSGIPVVAYNVGAVDEVVVDGLTGVLVPTQDHVGLAEAIRRVLAAPASYAGAAGRAHCTERFAITAVARSWDALLRTIERA